ncbi:hypothetical protein IFO70_20595 [Phormidium tenue FACHB-886]|nr:hypothetical protein [Phormidium tenue FACHB-886]
MSSKQPSVPQPSRAAFTLAPGFSPDPQVGMGKSGGTRQTECGYVQAETQPNHVIILSQPFEFLKASLQAEGDVTLLIKTPDGRSICSDDVNGLMPEISGEAPAGTYRIWIGDYIGKPEGSYPYQLKLTEQQN